MTNTSQDVQRETSSQKNGAEKTGNAKTGNATQTSRLKQLIEVAQEDSSNKRRDLLREITDVFMAAPDRYSSAEMQHFDVIMSRVTQNVELALRQEISSKLADEKNAPRGLVTLSLIHI